MDILKLLPRLFNVVVTAEYITLFTAIILLHKKQSGIWRLFIVLLFIIVFTETFGWYLRYFAHKNNTWLFNINMIVTVLFMLGLLSTAATLKPARKNVYILMLLFFILSIANLCFFQGVWKYNQYTEAIGDVMQVIVCCYVFYSFIKEAAYRNLLAYEYFWLANGILFFTMGSAFLYIFPTVLSNFQKHTGINIFTMLNGILNILLYGSLIIAFICRNRNTKSLQA